MADPFNYETIQQFEPNWLASLRSLRPGENPFRVISDFQITRVNFESRPK